MAISRGWRAHVRAHTGARAYADDPGGDSTDEPRRKPAPYDDLTGLPNRTRMMQHLESALARRLGAQARPRAAGMSDAGVSGAGVTGAGVSAVGSGVGPVDGAADGRADDAVDGAVDGRVDDAESRGRAGSGYGAAALNGHGAVDWHLAVLFCDIDRFRVVNDSLGRDAGDVLLQEMGRRLTEVVSGECGHGALVGRLANDEFVVICDQLPSADAATDLAKCIHETLGEAVDLGEDRIKVRVSIGVALANPAVQHAEDLLRHAEAANARAKAQGRDRIETFDARMQERAHNRLRTELDLAGACERGEMRLHYQPILHLGEGRVTGLEALVRWQHPTRGLLMPAKFIPLAEETGLVRTIGDWVMEEGFRQSREWCRAGLDVRVGVNISARQLTQDGFVDSVAALLERLGPDRILPHMELTESVLMTDPDTSAQALKELRELDVRLSLDDFGTGYSSLAYLQRFPVDILKIDRSFIDGIDSDERNRALVRAMVQLGHALDLMVLAEGIERPEERTVLEDMGIDLLQGYLIGRPVPADDLPLPTFLMAS